METGATPVLRRWQRLRLVGQPPRLPFGTADGGARKTMAGEGAGTTTGLPPGFSPRFGLRISSFFRHSSFVICREMNSMPDRTTSISSIRVLHLNSMLKGGGTDDQCVKLVAALAQLGQPVGICGPDGRDYSRVIRALGVPFYPTPPEGLAKWRFILSAVRSIRREGAQIVHGHHGRDIWPTVIAARLSGVRPKIVLTRHMAKSPASWVSQRHLLSQCDALFAVSEFVAKEIGRAHV